MLECLEFREEKNYESGSESKILDEMTPGYSSLFYGKFSFSGLEKGQGLTLSNTLRRILLYEIPSVGITSVFLRTKDNQQSESDGAEVTKANDLQSTFHEEAFSEYHEFSSLPAVKESVLEILYKLKGIVFENIFPYSVPQKAILKLSSSNLSSNSQAQLNSFKKNASESSLQDYKIRASQIVLPKELRIVNPEHILATLMNIETSFELELTIEKITQSNLNSLSSISGRALNRSTRNRRILPIDGTVFPVKKVNYTIENDSFDKEIVFFEVWTNGGIHPREALFEALHNAKNLFEKFI